MNSESSPTASTILSLQPVRDAEQLLHWRNQPHVRAAMITQELITLDDHLAWWARASTDATKRFFIVNHGDTPIAVLNFFDIDHEETGWWGFYLTGQKPDHINDLSIWTDVESLALRYAFEELGLKRLLCETRATNEPVLMLHDRFGFETLPSSGFPNAEKHNLIIKQMTQSKYAEVAQSVLSEEAVVADIPHDSFASTTPQLYFIGAANWDEIAADFTTAHFGWSGHRIAAKTTPFGQGMMALLDPSSELIQSDPDYLVFADRIEDFLPPMVPASSEMLAQIETRARDYFENIQEVRSRTSAQILVHDFAPVRPYMESLDEATARQGDFRTLVDRLNQELARLCAKISDCIILPISRTVAQVGVETADPGKYWLMGRFPFGAQFTPAYHKLLSGALMAMNGQTARALVLDLDNTMWGGVVGDDGTFGIDLGSDYPGNQFVSFQSFIKSIALQGVVLTLCSKNTEEIALSAFRENPDMVLKEEDFLTHRINWMPKSQNINELAQELDLGPASLMFIDDNPMEREEVRQNMPKVIVPEMPEDVAAWPRFLASHPALCAHKILDQDRDRVKKYVIRKQIQDIEKTSTDKHSFLSKLGMKIETTDLVPASRARTLQLFAKTNQFNTTTIRYSETDIDAHIATGGDVLTVRIQDKFGSDEIIAVLVVSYTATIARIESFVMSCRVMGRGVETAILAEVCKRAEVRGCDQVVGIIAETERNLPCRDVYTRHGFEAGPEGHFNLPLEMRVAFPDWFEYL